MTQHAGIHGDIHADILDQREPMSRYFVWALGLHVTLVGSIAIYNWVNLRGESFGAKDAGGGAIGIEAVSAIPIPRSGMANPVAMLASFGMALRYSLDMGALADKLDAAIAAVLAKGLRTADIKSEGTTVVSTSQMGDAVIAELQALHG